MKEVPRESLEKPKYIDRATAEVGMRVKLPDGQMCGEITKASDDKIAVLWDGTHSESSYDWNMVSFIKE